MKGDFTRERFDPARGYTRVLKQQGRVDLDADWNEQAAIQQHLLRTLIVDLLGPAAGPEADSGFGLETGTDSELKFDAGDFGIGAGRYYVGGLLVENASPLLYSKQHWPVPDGALELGHGYLAFLDVWERHVTWLDDPGLLEPALGGPDTCTRTQTTWQVRTIRAPLGGQGIPDNAVEIAEIKEKIAAAKEEIAALEREIENPADGTNVSALKGRHTRLVKSVEEAEARLEEISAEAPVEVEEDGASLCDSLLKDLRHWKSARMAARVRPEAPSDSPCVLPPESRYRGLENQLYRVEVHASGDTEDPNTPPQVKWSRNNGAIASPALGLAGKSLEIASARGFSAGCWVEILTEAQEAQGLGGFITRITAIDGNELLLEEAPDPLPDTAEKPRARRWDSGPTVIETDIGDAGWLALEDGIEVRFEPGSYRAGDYWLVPARVVTGEIEWPQDEAGEALFQLPKGVVHHYAPLFVVLAKDKAPFVSLIEDCRCRFARLPCLDG